MDVTLAELIAGMLHYMADTDSSYPGRLPFGEEQELEQEPTQEQEQEQEQEWTHETWKAYLHGLASAFDTYVMIHNDYYDCYSGEDTEQVLQNMRGLFDHYRHLWT